MILVTGATSQVGLVLIPKIKKAGYRVRCLVRKTSNIDEIKALGVELVYGDVESYSSLIPALDQVQHVIHIAGIWRASGLIQACEEQGLVGKVIFIGSTSRYKKLDSIDLREKQLAEQMSAAEEQIQKSSLNYIILRPTMLYGIDRDKNVLQIIKFMKRFRLYPLIGSGNALKHPVYVEDVAEAILGCLNRDISRKEYVIAGKEPVKHKQMLKSIRKNLPFRVFILRVPVLAGYTAVFFLKLIRPKTYINYAMIKRVNEDMKYDIGSAIRDIGYSPVDFETGVRKQIAYLKTKGMI